LKGFCLNYYKDTEIIPYPFIIILKYQKYHERHGVIKLKTISEGQGFEVPNNIHFRFGKRRNTSIFIFLRIIIIIINNRNMVI